MKCDTCKQEVSKVMRVVIYKGYDRLSAQPVYNCVSCFEAKERSKSYTESADS